MSTARKNETNTRRNNEKIPLFRQLEIYERRRRELTRLLNHLHYTLHRTMAANVNQPFTVLMAMQQCGLNAQQADQMATQLFRNDFRSCKDKSDDDLKDSYKTFASFTQAQGQIRLNPLQKDNIKAFNQWVKDQYRLNRDPALMPFPVHLVTDLLERAKTHKTFVMNSDSISATAKPEAFTADMRWEDWAPTFINFLRSIPGRDGVPLKYVIREQATPNPTPNTDFLDDYVENAPLVGSSFSSDAAIVHTYIVKFIGTNTEAESVIKQYEHERNGRQDWIALKAHYEGQGIYANEISQADRDLDNLVYQGEKKPHMWWALFERRLNQAFHTYVKREGRQVHSDEMKLRILLKKVRAEWLSSIKTSIDIELNRRIVNYTYDEALLAFRTEVNRKFPPGASASRIKRTIQELEGRSHHGSRNDHGGRGYRGGRGRGRFGGRGRGRYGGRGRGRGRGSHSGRGRWITLTDGQQIEYHPAKHYPDEIFAKFTQEQLDTLRRERSEHAAQHGSQASTNRTIQQLEARITEMESNRSVPSSVGDGAQSRISGVTQGTNMFGGRNEQASKRSRKRSSTEDEDS